MTQRQQLSYSARGLEIRPPAPLGCSLLSFLHPSAVADASHTSDATSSARVCGSVAGGGDTGLEATDAADADAELQVDSVE